MVKLPDNFVSIKYPGYFWNLTDHKLYSIKVDGELKPLARGEFVTKSGGGYTFHGVYGYRVSVKGKKRFLSEESLMKLKQNSSVISVKAA